MACFYPLKAYRPRSGTKLVFDKRAGYEDRPVVVPCGQCVGCRLERSRMWAVRCVHEACLFDDNCFITLTYSDDKVPYGNTLRLDHFQKFMKKLRFHYGSGVRFFHCGEYGEKYGRPHYHALLFNFDFKDKVVWKANKDGGPLYVSEQLETLWGHGLTSVGEVNFNSAAYVARYIMKKVTGDQAVSHYEYVTDYGEVVQRQPEYVTMSRRPGIGKGWIDVFQSDVYPRDLVVLNNKKFRPPRFYDDCYELTNTREYQALKARRVRKSAKHADNNTPDRLRVREEVQLARIERLKREV